MPMRALKTKSLAMRALTIGAFAALVLQPAGGQTDNSRIMASAKPAATAAAGHPVGSSPSDVAKTLKDAAETLGLARWSGVGGQRLPEVDVINTMEMWASGTTYSQSGTAIKTDYHASLGYNPPAMRVEMTRAGAAPQHTFEVVRDAYAWDESELGGGLVPGKGTATPVPAADSGRLLQLWILPYGVIKAAVAAGEKTKMSTDNGMTVLTFPLSGPLASVSVRATLDAENEVAKVETRTDNPALSNLNTETEYSEYADHGEILTDVKSPGHIVRKQGGHPVLDLKVKTLDANNPYLVFPVPPNVKAAAK